MRIVFFGLPDFGLSPLKKITKQKKDYIKLVVTDSFENKTGLTNSLYRVCPFLCREKDKFKKAVLTNGLESVSPANLKSEEFLNKIKKINPDLILVFTFHKIFPKALIGIPKYGVINFHPSLLPKYKGPTPIFWSIAKGEKYTGVSAHYMTEKLDSGPVVLKKEHLISREKTGSEIFKELSYLSGDMAVEIIEKLEKNGSLAASEQNQNENSYFPHFTKDDLKINLESPAEDIYNLVRAPRNWAMARLTHEGKELFIEKISLLEEKDPKKTQGEVISVDKGIKIHNKNGEAIVIESLGYSEKEILGYREFVDKYGFKKGSILS